MAVDIRSVVAVVVIINDNNVASGGVTDGFSGITDGYSSREDSTGGRRDGARSSGDSSSGRVDSVNCGSDGGSSNNVVVRVPVPLSVLTMQGLTAIANIKQDLTTVTITVNKPVLPAHQNMLKVDTNHLDLGFYSLTPNTFASVVDPDVNR